MATIAPPGTVEIRPIHEFDDAAEVWPRGARTDAIREAAGAFRERFARPDNRVLGVRTVDLASAAYPAQFAFGGAARAINPTSTSSTGWWSCSSRTSRVAFARWRGNPRSPRGRPRR